MLSGPHAPPRAFGASARIVTEPPETEIFLSLASAKKPIHFPSADQNCHEAPSVPASLSAVGLSRRRIQITFLSLGGCAAKAILVPSGERTGGPEKSPMKSKPMPGGAVMEARTGRGRGPAINATHTSALASAVTSSTQSIRSHCPRGCGAAIRATTADESLVLIQRS